MLDTIHIAYCSMSKTFENDISIVDFTVIVAKPFSVLIKIISKKILDAIEMK